jgi:endonuclease YncB( thermonuclease family)
MSRHLAVLATFLAFLLASVAFGQDLVLRGRCVGVHDGDSVTLLTSANTQIKIRVAFLDAPELSQDFGYRAKQAMSELVFGKEIAVYPYAIDRYGRTVGVVYVDGIDAGLELLKQGIAWCYTRYLSEAPSDVQASYRQAETEARAQRRGLWSDPAPLEPWEFRHAGKTAN